MPGIAPSPLSMLAGLRIDTANGGGGNLLQQVQDQTQKKKKFGAYAADDQQLQQFSPLSQWLARSMT